MYSYKTSTRPDKAGNLCDCDTWTDVVYLESTPGESQPNLSADKSIASRDIKIAFSISQTPEWR